MNFLEHLNFLIIGTMIAACGYPWVAFGLQCAIFLGRLLFTIGYMSKGPSGRIFGALIMDLAILVTFGMIIASAIKIS